MNEQENIENSAQKSPESLAQPGFIDLVKASLAFLGHYWGSYLKLAVVMAIPLILIYGAITFYFIYVFTLSALGMGNSYRAYAAPSIPSVPQEQDTNLDADQLAPLEADATLPSENGALENTSLPTGKENVQPSVPADSGAVTTPKTEKTSQKDMWGDFEGVGPSAFAPVAAVEGPTNLMSGFLQYFVGASMVMIIFVLLIALYQFVMILAFVRLTIVIEKGEYNGAMAVIKWSFRKIGTYIMLLLRIFFYTYMWVPFAAMALGLLAGALHVLPMASFMTAQYVLGLLSLLTAIVVLVRMPRTLFANYVMAERECASKEALHHSVEISMGHWWKIVLYLIGNGLVAGLLSGVLSAVIGKISPIAGSLVDLVLGILIAFYMIIFNFGLYRLLESLFGTARQS